MVFWLRESSFMGLAALLLTISCVGHHSGGREDYVWAESLRQDASNGSGFRLETGDLLRVDVWKQNDLSGNVRIRSDGKISLPLIGDVYVSGLTPIEAGELVSERLVRVVRNPSVVISVVEVRPIQVAVIGEVESPGMYQMERGCGVLHALAMAGGLNEYADPQRIFVIRNSNPSDGGLPIRFTYRMLVRSGSSARYFALAQGDIIVVE